MRRLDEVDPSPATELDILRFGLQEIAMLSPGAHGFPVSDAKREIKDYAKSILEAAAVVDIHE